MSVLDVLRVCACLVMFASTVAHADDVTEKRARELFVAGRTAFNEGDYPRAYEDFKQAYVLSQEPALLYNIASTQQRLNRPHDAAETLRSYLRLRAEDPERDGIEERIRTLEETQRLLDAEHPPAPRPPLPAEPNPAAVRLAVPLPASPPAAPPRRHRTAIIVVSTLAAALIVGGAIGLGVGLSSSGGDPLPSTTLGVFKGTR